MLWKRCFLQKILGNKSNKLWGYQAAKQKLREIEATCSHALLQDFLRRTKTNFQHFPYVAMQVILTLLRCIHWFLMCFTALFRPSYWVSFKTTAPQTSLLLVPIRHHKHIAASACTPTSSHSILLVGEYEVYKGTSGWHGLVQKQKGDWSKSWNTLHKIQNLWIG